MGICDRNYFRGSSGGWGSGPGSWPPVCKAIVLINIAHAAHLGGLAFGFVYWNQRLRLAPLVDSIQKFDWRKKFRSHSNLKLHLPPTGTRKPQETAVSPVSSDQNQVDELLVKISREGRENLSAEELEVLNQASERLRRKRK